MSPYPYSGPPTHLPMGMATAARIDPLDIRGLLACLWRGKWVVVLTTAAAVFLGVYYAFAIAQPRYAATATLHITKPANLVQQANAALNPESEVAILQSFALLEQVADQLDLQDDPEFNRYLSPAPLWSPSSLRTRVRLWLMGQPDTAPDQDAITAKTLRNLQAAITAQAPDGSSVFTVTATTGSEQKSIHIANTLAAIYLLDQSQSAQNRARNTIAWLSDKVAEQQNVLASKEMAISDLLLQADVTDQATYDDLTHQAQETAQRLQDAKIALTTQARTGDTSTNLRRLETQVATLEIQRANLRNRLAGQSAGLVHLHQLEREIEATRVLYETFLGRLRDASLQGGLLQTQSRILSPAGPARYVAPRKTLTVGLAAVFGAVLGVSLVFLRDAMQSGFRQTGPLHASTGVPVMAQVPLVHLRKPAQLLDRLADPSFGPIHDAISNLRTELLLSDPKEPPQIILSTASLPQEGKTLNSILLAQALSNLGKTVLLFDADFRGPGVTPYLPKTQGANLAGVIAEHMPLANAISHDARWSVDVLKGIATDTGAPDLFATASFARFLHSLRARYDHIVVNAPPVLPVPDAKMLAQQADAVIYAVRWNKTPLDLILAGQEALDHVHAPITGLVMSQVDPKRAGKIGRVTMKGYTRRPA